jgi:hypothetical protein
VPGKEVISLGGIWLNATFGQPNNFRKELLTFEVVDFPVIYHALLSQPCFANSMAIPNYTYLKLKMPGRKGSSLSRVALSKPTTPSKPVLHKRTHSSPLALPMALAVT